MGMAKGVLDYQVPGSGAVGTANGGWNQWAVAGSQREGGQWCGLGGQWHGGVGGAVPTDRQ